MKHFTIALIIISAVFCGCSGPSSQLNGNDSKSANAPLLIPDTTWTTKVEKTNAEWKKILTSEQFNITREQGTERPYSSEYEKNHETGIYYCVSCKNPLFNSATKFESGTGWPSFYAPYSTKSVRVAIDNSAGSSRDEISCQRCGAHLGHVFNDGPKPTGLRYCMDGVALVFQKEDANVKLSKATFAAGCFWCEEAVFESVKGVKEAISGYAGGEKENPTYEEVGSGTTGHAESVEVYYDSTQVSYPSLLKVYFASEDPTQVNGQGPDHGTPYRSLIFYRDSTEKRLAENYIDQLNKSGKYKDPIAVQVVPYTKFWQAEDYHQNYVAINPGERYVQMESIPRLRRAQKEFPELVKPDKVQK
ncbi:MAG: bifunctional methionine sulfoxide reductase B/A protein [Ferruginibacter sp.]